MRHEVDCLIVGSGFGALACGTVLARRGWRVMLLTRRPLEESFSWVEGGITYDRSPELLWGFEEGGLLRPLLPPPDGGPAVSRAEPGVQVVLPRHRVGIYRLGADWQRELTREFPDGVAAMLRATERLCRLAEAVRRDRATRLGRIRTWARASVVGRYPLRYFLRRQGLALPDGAVAEALSAACFQVVPEATTVGMAAVAFGHAQRGFFAPSGSMKAFAGRLVARFREMGGEVRTEAIGEIKSAWGAVRGVITMDGGVVSCRYLAWEPEPNAGDRILHLTVDEALIPGEMGRNVLLVETDPAKAIPVGLLHLSLGSIGTRLDSGSDERAVVIRILQPPLSDLRALLDQAFPGWGKARISPSPPARLRVDPGPLTRRWPRPRNVFVIPQEGLLGRGGSTAAWQGYYLATRLLARS